MQNQIRKCGLCHPQLCLNPAPLHTHASSCHAADVLSLLWHHASFRPSVLPLHFAAAEYQFDQILVACRCDLASITCDHTTDVLLRCCRLHLREQL